MFRTYNVTNCIYSRVAPRARARLCEYVSTSLTAETTRAYLRLTVLYRILQNLSLSHSRNITYCYLIGVS